MAFGSCLEQTVWKGVLHIILDGGGLRAGLVHDGMVVDGTGCCGYTL
jgi:hypothetical protein